MGIKADMGASLQWLFETAGEDAAFTPAAGGPIPCKVFIDFGVQYQPAGTEAQIWERGTFIEALLSDAPDVGIGTTEPNRGETFTLAGGIVYTVKAILTNDGLTVKVVVT